MHAQTASFNRPTLVLTISETMSLKFECIAGTLCVCGGVAVSGSSHGSWAGLRLREREDAV